jgi:hypothetical protein
MMFLTRGATYPGLPFEFAYPAAFGDLLTAIIALVTIPIMLRGSAFAKAAVWFFNIFGTVDLVVAIIHATIYDARHHGTGLLDSGVLGAVTIGDPTT